MNAPDPDGDRSRVTSHSTVQEIREIVSDREGGLRLTADELLTASEIVHPHDLALAIVVMELLLEKEPNDPRWHLRLADLVVRAGDLARAEVHCVRATELDGGSAQGYRLLNYVRARQANHRGAVDAAVALERVVGASRDLHLLIASQSLHADMPAESLARVHRVNDLGPPDEESLLLETEACYRLGERHAAVVALERACRLFPDAPAPAAKLAYLLCELQEYGKAVPALARARTLTPDDAVLACHQAIAFRALGNYREGLAAIQDALALTPAYGEYLYICGTIYDRLGERDQALKFINLAVEAEPDRLGFVTTLAHMTANAGDSAKALAILDHFQKVNPADSSIRDLKIALLANRAPGDIRESRSDDVGFGPMPTARRHRARGATPSLFESLLVQARVVATLMRRDFRHRAAHSKFGFFMVFVPVALQIVTLGVVLSLFNGGRPPLGEDLFFFYATGVMPFYMFIHVVDHAQQQFQDNRDLFQIPIITRLDVVLGMACSELFVTGMMVVVTFLVFALVDYGPVSGNYIQCIYAMLAIWAFALGVGLICAVMNNLYKPFANVWLVTQRFLYIASGVFFTPQQMPEWIRDYLVWNPILQTIEWFRTGMFEHHEPPWLDKGYVLSLAFVVILIGLMMERGLRPKMKTQ